MAVVRYIYEFVLKYSEYINNKERIYILIILYV